MGKKKRGQGVLSLLFIKNSSRNYITPGITTIKIQPVKLRKQFLKETEQ